MIIPLNDLKRRHAPLETELRNACGAVIGSSLYSMGPWLEEFEKAFAAYCGAAHAVGVSSGTDALELALRVAGCGAGDEVITVANAGGYATAAILQTGAKPAYADIDAAAFLITPDTLGKAVTTKSRVVIVTHLFGAMADMPSLCAVAAKHGLIVIEDCAQAHGSVLQRKKAGTWGDMGCYSFYPTKNLGGIGDAGCVITSDANTASHLQSLRQYGWRDKKYHCPEDIGRNCRMDDIQAAVLTLLLPMLDGWNEERRAIMQHYRESLEPMGIQFQKYGDAESANGHLCVIRVRQRERLIAWLQQHGITTGIHYPVADYNQPAFIKRYGETPKLQVTEQYLSEIITIPCFPELTDDEVSRIVQALKTFQ